jgi:hypothetical protein
LLILFYRRNIFRLESIRHAPESPAEISLNVQNGLHLFRIFFKLTVYYWNFSMELPCNWLVA